MAFGERHGEAAGAAANIDERPAGGEVERAGEPGSASTSCGIERSKERVSHILGEIGIVMVCQRPPGPDRCGGLREGAPQLRQEPDALGKRAGTSADEVAVRFGGVGEASVRGGKQADAGQVEEQPAETARLSPDRDGKLIKRARTIV
jgi:hypothetical protein